MAVVISTVADDEEYLSKVAAFLRMMGTTARRTLH